MAYVPDVFGGTRRQVESLKAQADSQRFQLEATYLTLTSNVVAAAVQEAALRGQIEATKRVIDIQSKSLELLQRQYELGQIATADVVAQEAALAQVQAMLPPLGKTIGTTARLAGLALPAVSQARQLDRGVRTLITAACREELPVSLPSKLVAQRPDVRSAEEQLHAASADIGVSIANRSAEHYS